MQVLGKRSKVLLMVIAIAMLIAVGASFAMWDMSAVKATNGDLSDYANAKVGDIIEFGRYYQTGNRINNDENAEYEKTPIEWLVVDKDERTGQLTLMSKYILAAGSYFGNYYYNAANTSNFYYNLSNVEVGEIPYNQAYVESTARAFLNNLERRDLGGDSYDGSNYKTSVTSSNKLLGKLLTSVGFSNRYHNIGSNYKRSIKNAEYKNRPATRGFYDEAFNDNERAMIEPKVIGGYVGHKWPTESSDNTFASYVGGAIDKIWIPSATELNIMNADSNYTNSSDVSGSTVFKYFQTKTDKNLEDALKTKRTPFVENNSKAMSYSIPVYKYQSVDINEDIHDKSNSTNNYWTRSPMSSDCRKIRIVKSQGRFDSDITINSIYGVRPCIILKY